MSKLKLGDILAVIRELRAILPAQLEHEGLPPILVQVVAGARSCPTGPTNIDTGGGEAQSAVLAAPLAPPEAARVRAHRQSAIDDLAGKYEEGVAIKNDRALSAVA